MTTMALAPESMIQTDTAYSEMDAMSVGALWRHPAAARLRPNGTARRVPVQVVVPGRGFGYERTQALT
jgi:hypothetical protein